MSSPHPDAAVIMAGPGDIGISGGDMHGLRLVDRWREQGAELRLLAPARLADVARPSGAPRDVTALRTPLDGRMTSMPAYTLAVLLRGLLAARAAGRPRVAVATSHFLQDVLPVAWLGRRGAFVAVYAYHLVGDAGRRRGLRSAVSIAGERLSLGLLRRAADVVFVDNEETAVTLLDAGFAPAQLVRTQNAYDPVGPLPPATVPARPSVVFVGRLVEVKGVDVVLDLAAELRRRGLAADVALLGDGPERGRLEARVRDERLEGVRVAGFVDEEEKWRTLRGASLFVAPSREEGWGIALGEAFLCGVPGVAFDLPAYEHFGGLPERVALGDAAAFVARAADLLTDPAELAGVRARVVAGEAQLPRWSTVLDAEIAALDVAR